MIKLKVRWQGGSWSNLGDQPVEEELLDGNVQIRREGEALVFFLTTNSILLVVPQNRLLSAVRVDDGAVG